jgi:putative FmdB family regulatory protein
MPLYEYLCDSCGQNFEQRQSINDAPLHICPFCGGTVHRIIPHNVMVIYKGSGFYSTDHASHSGNNGHKPVREKSETPSGSESSNSSKSATSEKSMTGSHNNGNSGE